MILYNLAAAYWQGQPVGYEASIIYSSAARAIVATTDPGFAAWLAANHTSRGLPWPFDEKGAATIAALDAVLTSAGLPATGLAALSAAQLILYAIAKADLIQSGGVTVNVAAPGAAAIELQCATTSADLTQLNLAVQRAGLDPNAVLKWEQRDGTSVGLTAPQTQALGLAVANWLQSIWDQRTQQIQPAIAAGKITSIAQVDDPTTVSLPAWPVNS